MTQIRHTTHVNERLSADVDTHELVRRVLTRPRVAHDVVESFAAVNAVHAANIRTDRNVILVLDTRVLPLSSMNQQDLCNKKKLDRNHRQKIRTQDTKHINFYNPVKIIHRFILKLPDALCKN